MLEEGLQQLLAADSGVSALIGTRIYPVQGPASNPTYPYVTYKNIPSPGTEYTFGASEKTFFAGIQFDAFGPSYIANKRVLRAIDAVLSGYTGTLPDTDATRVIFAAQTASPDHFENDGKVFRSIAEYEVQYA